MIIPVPLAILREIHFICSSQLSLLSIIIAKNFALSTSWILDPFISIVGQISFFPLGLNIIKFVLSLLRDNRLAYNHFITLLSSLFITVDNSCKLLALQNNVVSFANRIEKSAQDTEAISIMYKIDKHLWAYIREISFKFRNLHSLLCNQWIACNICNISRLKKNVLNFRLISPYVLKENEPLLQDWHGPIL